MSYNNKEEGTDDFNIVGEDIMDLVLTDLVVLNKKEKSPPNYVAVEPPVSDGGRLSFTKRYLSYSREIPNPRFGRVALTDIKVLSSDQAPVGYRALSETHDDNSKSFNSKLIAIKLVPLEEASEAITDILVLTGAKRENVPSGYKRLPEINGYSLCFQVTKLNKKKQENSQTITQKTDQRARTETTEPIYERQVSKKVRSAIDGLTFKVNQPNENYVSQFLLPEMSILSLDDIDHKFNFDWSFEELVAQQT